MKFLGEYNMSALLSIDRLALFVCRLGFAGLSPRAPGTCGTALAAVIAPWCFLPLSYFWRGVVLLMIFFLGALAATRAERILGVKDPGQVVIDELLGLWLVLWPFAQPSWKTILTAFVLFRVFDIVKFWPVRASETWLPDGYGVMLDDVLAGVQALLALVVLRALWGAF
jgi:phosphatidylglycerophosphatase A